jgi:hypothetical protein
VIDGVLVCEMALNKARICERLELAESRAPRKPDDRTGLHDVVRSAYAVDATHRKNNTLPL